MRADGLAPAAVVRLADDRAVVARVDRTRVQVIGFAEVEDRWTVQEIAASEAGDGPASAHLATFGGDTGDAWNTYFYGTAPGSVSRVTVDGFSAEGGQVVDGAWVLVMREKDVSPRGMRWQFLDAFGGVVDSGTGIFPPAD